MGRVVGIIGIVVLSFATQAQQKEHDAIDSLQRVLAETKADYYTSHFTLIN